ncbi:transmembrane emp24 domain-containing protein 10-like [Acipenser oxyrinchus oxyrinchus]|uniref:Transmembrane emp24 domain-containing protein 10-like n=1 Tax=Acipenser oxyrinchus oxyrinchus TaxID=40147 RepID=A0AAD8CNJ0_ACIOX|nr:transmembrane emp24 domain-containing protein 10-like [Acipenser oxyrinchus oxyrinchus]
MGWYSLNVGVLLCVLLHEYGVHGISFYLPPLARKCLREEIRKDVLVTGQYEVAEVHDVVTNLKVTDSAEHTLYKKDDAQKGKFAFSTDNFDEFDICFESVVPAGFEGVTEQLIVLNIKHGTEAKDYENIAKVEKLKPLEVKLKQMEDLSESIVKELSYMKSNAEHRSNTNESTSSRVLGFSLLSMLCLVSLAVWQLFYLRRFFKSKRLIE